MIGHDLPAGITKLGKICGVGTDGGIVFLYGSLKNLIKLLQTDLFCVVVWIFLHKELDPVVGLRYRLPDTSTILCAMTIGQSECEVEILEKRAERRHP